MQTSGSAAIKKLIQLVKAAVSDALTEAKAYTDNAAAGGADYIESQGTTGKWTWRKWHSGVAEMWATFDVGELVMTSQTWGALYTASWMGLAVNKKARAYPFAFYRKPSRVCDANGHKRQHLACHKHGKRHRYAADARPGVSVRESIRCGC